MNARPAARGPREVLSSSLPTIRASGNSASFRAGKLRLKRRPLSVAQPIAAVAKLRIRVAKSLNRPGKETTSVSKKNSDIGAELFPWMRVNATARPRSAFPIVRFNGESSRRVRNTGVT